LILLTTGHWPLTTATGNKTFYSHIFYPDLLPEITELPSKLNASQTLSLHFASSAKCKDNDITPIAKKTFVRCLFLLKNQHLQIVLSMLRSYLYISRLTQSVKITLHIPGHCPLRYASKYSMVRCLGSSSGRGLNSIFNLDPVRWIIFNGSAHDIPVFLRLRSACSGSEEKTGSKNSSSRHHYLTSAEFLTVSRESGRYLYTSRLTQCVKITADLIPSSRAADWPEFRRRRIYYGDPQVAPYQ